MYTQMTVLCTRMCIVKTKVHVYIIRYSCHYTYGNPNSEETSNTCTTQQLMYTAILTQGIQTWESNSHTISVQ